MTRPSFLLAGALALAVSLLAGCSSATSPVQQSAPPGEGPGWTLRWSPLGLLVAVTTPGGARWEADLDEHHRVAAATDPVGRETALAHDEPSPSTR